MCADMKRKKAREWGQGWEAWYACLVPCLPTAEKEKEKDLPQKYLFRKRACLSNLA